jgi:hypothetical protein
VAGDDPAAARKDGEARLFVDLEPVTTISMRHDVGDDCAAPCGRTMSQSFKEAPRLANSLPLSGPVQLAASTGFAWAKKPRPDAMAAAKRSSSKCPGTKNDGEVDAARAATATTAPYQVEKQEVIKQWTQVAEAFSSSEAHNNRFRQTVDAKQLKTGKVHCCLLLHCIAVLFFLFCLSH